MVYVAAKIKSYKFIASLFRCALCFSSHFLGGRSFVKTLRPGCWEKIQTSSQRQEGRRLANNHMSGLGGRFFKLESWRWPQPLLTWTATPWEIPDQNPTLKLPQDCWLTETGRSNLVPKVPNLERMKNRNLEVMGWQEKQRHLLRWWTVFGRWLRKPHIVY